MLRTSACGGIGRRAGFRFQCPLGRGSSSLPRRTKDIGNENQVFGPGFFLLGKFGGHCGSQSCCLRSAHPHSTLMLRCVQPCWFDRAPTCTAPYPPRAGATVLPPAPTLPVHARAASRPVYLPCAGPASRRPSEPLFHHAVSKRPDHQLHAIMCPRLCHGGR